MSEPSGQAAGLASKTAARQAFCRVVRRAGRAIGRASLVLAMLACPGEELTLTVKAAPFALEALPLVEALRVGWKGRAPQPWTWKGLLSGTDSPSAPESVPVIAAGLQLVGLNWKPGRSIVTASSLIWAGTPLTKVGKGSLVIVTAAVDGSTLILERTVTSPRLKGPAIAGVTTEIPKGAPS